MCRHVPIHRTQRMTSELCATDLPPLTFELELHARACVLALSSYSHATWNLQNPGVAGWCSAWGLLCISASAVQGNLYPTAGSPGAAFLSPLGRQVPYKGPRPADWHPSFLLFDKVMVYLTVICNNERQTFLVRMGLFFHTTHGCFACYAC